MADDAHTQGEQAPGGPSQPARIGDPANAPADAPGDVAAAPSSGDRRDVEATVGHALPAPTTDPTLELLVDHNEPAPSTEPEPARAAADQPHPNRTPSGAKFGPTDDLDLADLTAHRPARPPAPEPEPDFDERKTIKVPRPEQAGIPTGHEGARVEPSKDDAAPPLPVEDVDQAEPPPPPQPRVSTMEASRALWKEREPEDPTDPVEHLTAQRLHGENGAWLAAASRRGRSHAHDAKYREDHYALRVESGWLLIAVGDGTGSRPLARVGSRVACEAAIEYLARGLAYTEGDTPIDERLRGSLAGAMVHALAQVADEAARRRRDIDDFATTLLLVAANISPEETWIGIGQVGDGAIAAVLQTGECQMLGKSDHGNFGGESAFLTSPEVQLTWPKRVFSYRVDRPLKMIAVGSDGVMDDFTEPFGKIETLFEQLEPIVAAEAPEQALLEWMAYERRGSFDDRTLALLVPGQSIAEPSP